MSEAIHLLPDNKFEELRLKELGESCGATAASIIRVDRSGRNKRESDGLLFEQVTKWKSPKAGPPKQDWKRCGDEFFGKDETWGVTGEAFLYGRVIDVTDIRADGQDLNARILEPKDIYEKCLTKPSTGPIILASQQFVEDFNIKTGQSLGREKLRGLPGKRSIHRLPLTQKKLRTAGP